MSKVSNIVEKWIKHEFHSVLLLQFNTPKVIKDFALLYNIMHSIICMHAYILCIYLRT